MTKNERAGVLLVGAVIASFVAVVITGAADTLGQHTWFSNGANVIQWISGPGTFAAVAVAIGAYVNRKCAASFTCFRHGEHPVDGCLKKVCDHHHTRGDHWRVHVKYRKQYRESGRLARGQSHDGIKS